MKIWLALFLSILFLSGCGFNNGNNNQDNNSKVSVNNSTIQNVDRKTGQQISKHLVNLATSIKGVNDATAVVLGKYAIVGIDVNSNIDRSQVGSIKYAVSEGLKDDPNGANAMVVADPDMTARLREISEDIQKGEPIQGIINELADISGRLMPEIPADIIDPNTKSQTDKPKNKQNSNDNRQLEQKQDKQSNHQKD
ncbi:YhcN/YlaJ family sporulation lipoprotein [Bacillus massilinigeriensis]|uniref:YhcN/YlaJ family sporulation lipoprotein n=1 Tax=Bacillus massilionigeriensis TaxID=1805475 RepID=UPI00096B6431|nr:YhcN/YlaJ family sporulation lipoprotein [Bacillus massilionigeriensis]